LKGGEKMQKFKKALSTMLAVVFVLMVCTSYVPVSAAPKAVKPQVKLNTAPLKQYMVGDNVNIKVSAPNYSGKVQYRVMLINAKGGYKEIFTTSDHYTKSIGSGKTILPIRVPVTEAGTYSVQVLVKSSGAKVSYDTLVKTANFTVVPKSVIYSRAGNTYVYPNTLTIDVDSKVISKDITVDNAIFTKSLYVAADNVTLKNLNVKGTLSIDPGKDGVTTLENVTANEIRILSGGTNSIHLKSVNANKLVIDSTSNVRVASTGTTKIGSTEVTSYAILDSQGGTLGTITVSKSAKGVFDVEFRGTFTEPIVVATQANIKSAAGASIAKVVIAPSTKNEVIKLEGAFKTVEITKESKVELGAGTTVKDVQAKANSDIKLAADAKIELVNKAEGVEATTEGGTVDNTTINGSPQTPTPGTGTNPGTDTGTGPGPDPTPVKPAITSIAGQSVSGAEISLSVSKLTKQMPINVSMDSVAAFIIPGLGDMGGFQLKASQDNTILNIPMPGLQPINFEAVNTSVLFNALMSADSATKQALIDGVNFRILLDSLQNADTATKAGVIRALNMTNILNAMQSADEASKSIFYNNIAQIFQLTINDGNKDELFAAIYSPELASVLTSDQRNMLLAALDNGNIANIDFQGIFNSIKGAEIETQNTIFEKIDFEAVYNIVVALEDGVINQVFATINFTNIFNAVLEADSNTKTKFYEDMISIINIVESDNAITRTIVLSAIDFSKISTQQKYDILDRLDGISGDGLRVEIVLLASNSTNNTNTYYVTFTNN
jgi:hypothetical protein